MRKSDVIAWVTLKGLAQEKIFKYNLDFLLSFSGTFSGPRTVTLKMKPETNKDISQIEPYDKE